LEYKGTKAGLRLNTVVRALGFCMSQVNFFMTAEDEATFLDFLFSRTDTYVLEGRFFESRNPVPLASRNEVGQADMLTLANKELMPEAIAGSGGPGAYLFDMYYDPHIEFSRCRTSNKRLLKGRIYAKIGWLKRKEANVVYKKWYGSIERWLKKEYRRVDKTWWFGPRAWEWSMAGGVCCFGDELAFAASLAAVDKAWLET
jgi:hypothetical protein